MCVCVCGVCVCGFVDVCGCVGLCGCVRVCCVKMMVVLYLWRGAQTL